MAVMTVIQPLDGIEPPIKIYVRKGADDEERYLTFRIPDWLSQGEVLDQGWAIDGNQVLVAVGKRDLLSTERKLVEWFRQKGQHGITFC